eukprot:3787556-Alexandrium_andersonii.AAC.1
MPVPTIDVDRPQEQRPEHVTAGNVWRLQLDGWAGVLGLSDAGGPQARARETHAPASKLRQPPRMDAP